MPTAASLTPSIRQLAQMALLLAALVAVELSIIPFSGAGLLWFAIDWYYSVANVALLILCARVTGYPFAVGVLAVCKGLLGLVFMSQGGPLMVFYEILPVLVVQVVFLLSRTNGEKLWIDVAAGILHGFASGWIFFFIIVGLIGMELPSWLVWLRITSVTLTSGVGGWVGWRVGKRIGRGACRA